MHQRLNVLQVISGECNLTPHKNKIQFSTLKKLTWLKKLQQVNKFTKKKHIFLGVYKFTVCLHSLVKILYKLYNTPKNSDQRCKWCCYHYVNRIENQRKYDRTSLNILSTLIETFTDLIPYGLVNMSRKYHFFFFFTAINDYEMLAVENNKLKCKGG